MTHTTYSPASDRARPTPGTMPQHDPKRDVHASEGEKRTGAAGSEPGGRTTIADVVAAKIAGMAAREVPGIHHLGSGMTRAIGGVRDRMPGGRTSVTRGVSVEVGERQAAVDLDVVTDYGYPIAEVAAETRAEVIATLERMTGLEVVEVNIDVNDVALPGADEEDEDEGDRNRQRVD
ncbi:Asp23/Gls24 family envelope stress response protein [Streptomyces sp. Tu 4128]|uniref:Asp23/Gls24 family envelope stress response protein n=2 Tax=Streptomyces TaxID=1883 RepID=UPI001F11EDA8|nr:Asp23/Gls24 family envelope stress response protein [Streptomyces sp. Tu 4128]